MREADVLSRSSKLNYGTPRAGALGYRGERSRRSCAAFTRRPVARTLQNLQLFREHIKFTRKPQGYIRKNTMDHKRHCFGLTTIQTLPEEVLQLIFSHLAFDDKCRCCLVCILWNKVLRSPEPALWREVLLDLALVVRRIGVEADRWQDVCKWFAFRSGGVQKVKFRAIMTLEDDSKPIKELVQVLNEQFAFLAGAMTWKRTAMYLDLSFKGTAKGSYQTLPDLFEGFAVGLHFSAYCSA